jgi:hypothetical protein
MKIFVKALNKEGKAFTYFRKKFLRLSEAKIKEGIFIGPQINTVLQDTAFEILSDTEKKKAWTAFKFLCSSILGNEKSENYMEIVSEMLESFQAMKCNLSLILHFLHPHLDSSLPNLGAVSDEHGERFYQGISTMEKKYAGKSMLMEYCWCMVRDTPE